MAEWVRAKYGESWKMHLTGALSLSVSREIGTRGGPAPWYAAGAFGAILKQRFETADEAKAAAVAFARRQFDAAINAL